MAVMQSVNKLQADVEALQPKLSDAEDEIARLNAKNRDQTARACASSDALKLLEDKVCKYKEDLESLRVDRDRSVTECSSVQRSVNLAEQACTAAESNLSLSQSRVASLEFEVARLKEANSVQTREIAELSAALTRATTTMASQGERLKRV